MYHVFLLQIRVESQHFKLISKLLLMVCLKCIYLKFICNKLHFIFTVSCLNQNFKRIYL